MVYNKNIPKFFWIFLNFNDQIKAFQFCGINIFMLTPDDFNLATFVTSAPSLKECPAEIGWEIAFAGRSNAGKSSALNCITKNGIAKTSKTPGRTQLINFFKVKENMSLVDLPGYGFAKVPLAVRQKWQKNLKKYLLDRRNLLGLVLVMDIRHPLTDLDWQLLTLVSERNLKLHLLLTKADKLKFSALKSTLADVTKQIKKANIDASVQTFSSLKKQGVEEAKQTLISWLEALDS